jgi:hypothetical protein
MCGRNYELVKGSSLRVKIESKQETKSRLGRSPDLADAAFLCLDMARQRHGMVAVEPLPAKESGFRNPGNTFQSLQNALSSEMSAPLD